MASGKWVNVPGKGRRFLTSEGEYRYGDPNAPLAPAASAVKTFFGNLLNSPARFSPEQMRGLTAPGLEAAASSPFTKGQQRSDGKFYTGSAYGWQSGPSAARAGLLGSEVVGDAAFSSLPSPMGPPIPARIANAPTPLALPSPVSSSPQERAYQSSKAEAAAMTASDPLFQKYQVADLTKAYNSAKTNEEKQAIGLQIWAQTNPQLAAKLRPGQTGYEEVRQAPGMMGSTANFRPMANSVLPAGTDAAGVAGPPVFAQPENPLEEVLPPGMLGSSYQGGLNFPESLVPAGAAQSLPTESFAPVSLDVFDPSTINMDQIKRKLLTQAYNRGLK